MKEELYHAHHAAVYREAADLDMVYDVGEILDNRETEGGEVLEP